MADIQRTVEIIFGAVDNTGSGMSSVASSLNSTVNAASNITKPLSEVADFALKAEAAVLAMGATFLTVAVNEASKFGEKIEEINSLVNGSPEDYQKLKSSIQDFAANSTSGFDAIGQAMYIATSNLGSTSKALDILTVAEKGAIVGATDIESTTALLTRTMNAYGLVTNDSATNTANAERVMAAMFATVQNGDINMQALSDNLGKVASTASAAGVPIETVGAAVAALTGAGINADQSMTLLNSVLKELLSPSDDLKKALGGVSVTANGLPAVLNALKQATGGSADKIYELFSSSEAAKGALILVNDNAGKFDATLKAMDGSVNAFNTNYKTMVGGVKDSTQILVNQATILLQKVGDPLQDGWADILDGLSAMMAGFSVSIDQGAFDDVFRAFDGFSDDIAKTMQQIAKNLPAALEKVDFSGLIKSLSGLGLEIGDLFGDIDLSTPEGLAKAIQFVVDSFESLNHVISGIIDAWRPVVKGFIAGTEAFNGLDGSAKKTVGQFLGLAQIFETLKGAVISGADALDTIGKAMQAIAGIQASQQIVAIATALGGATFAAGAAALAAVGFAIKANADAWQEYKARQDSVADSTEHLKASQTGIKDKLEEISKSTGIAVNSMDELNKAVDDGRLVFNEASGAYEKAGSGVRDYDAEVAAASKSGTWFADAVNDVAKSLGVANEAATDAAGTFATLAEAEAAALKEIDKGHTTSITFADGLYTLHSVQKQAAESSKELGDATKNSAEAAKVGSSAWKTVQDVLLATQKQTDDFTIKLGELANKRYEIDVRANVDLKTAEIVAQTARIASAFQAISEVVGALSPEISNLWKLFSDKAGFVGGKELQEAAIRMEERLDKELEQKQKLTDAIIAKTNAQADRFRSGDALISIDSGDLAPELDSLFLKVLKKVQIKATEEGFNLLMGLGAD
jgi:TP901 family phage tail tape measure protein